MTTYILSLDGGGIRGYLTVTMLERLENETGFLKQIDLFAGTSIGSILALGLAKGMTPTELRSMFDEQGEDIFRDSFLDDVRDIYFTRGAKYSNKNLAQVLDERFGEATLGDLDRKVLIPTFDLDNGSYDYRNPRRWKPKFFHNYDEGDPGASDKGELIVDVALRSSAAPIYFPTYQGYVDGFVVANNPSMCALSQVLHSTDTVLDDIVVLSLGTGLNPRFFPEQEADWGLRQWLFQLRLRQQKMYAMPLIYMMWEASVDTANYQCRQLIGDKFHRLDPVMPVVVDIDAVDQMDVLAEVGLDIDIAETVDWIKQYVLPASSETASSEATETADLRLLGDQSQAESKASA